MHFQVREKNSSIPGSELNMDAIAKWNDRGPRDVSSLDFGKTGIKKGKKQKKKTQWVNKKSCHQFNFHVVTVQVWVGGREWEKNQLYL